MTTLKSSSELNSQKIDQNLLKINTNAQKTTDLQTNMTKLSASL